MRRGATLDYMSAPRPAPARPWYDRVTAEIALRGWTKTQLSERSGVSRTAIDKWQKNPRPPQAASVNAVADALGIPRERALRLAGVIPEVPREFSPDLQELMRQEVGDEMAANLIAHYEHLASGRLPPASGDGPARGSGGRGRRSAG